MNAYFIQVYYFPNTGQCLKQNNVCYSFVTITYQNKALCTNKVLYKYLFNWTKWLYFFFSTSYIGGKLPCIQLTQFQSPETIWPPETSMKDPEHREEVNPKSAMYGPQTKKTTWLRMKLKTYLTKISHKYYHTGNRNGGNFKTEGIFVIAR